MSLNWAIECLLAQLLQQQKVVILLPSVSLYNLHLRLCSSYQKGQMLFSLFNEKVQNNLWPETFALIVYAYSSQFNEAISLQCALETMPIVRWLTELCIKLSEKKRLKISSFFLFRPNLLLFLFLQQIACLCKGILFLFYCCCNFCCVEISFSLQLFKYSFYLCRSEYSLHSERHGMYAIREKKWSDLQFLSGTFSLVISFRRASNE